MSMALVLWSLILAADAMAPVDVGGTPVTVPAPDAPVLPAPLVVPIAIAGVTTSEPVVALTFDACATQKQANGLDRKIFEKETFKSRRWLYVSSDSVNLPAARFYKKLGVSRAARLLGLMRDGRTATLWRRGRTGPGHRPQVSG